MRGERNYLPGLCCESNNEGGGGGGGGGRFGGDCGGDSGSSLKGKQPGGSLRAVNWDRVELKPFDKNFYMPSLPARTWTPGR